MNIRKNDKVYILKGKDRGKTGVVERAIPSSGKVVVAGINIATKHQKPKQNVKQVGRITINLPIYAANVALICGKCGKYAKISTRVLKDGNKERICKKCGEAI